MWKKKKNTVMPMSRFWKWGRGMFNKIKDILKKCFKLTNVGVRNTPENDEAVQEDLKDRKYRNIPLYTKEEMQNAIIDDSDEVTRGCLGRQALNGYVGIYEDKWRVGRRRDGRIVKSCKPLLFENSNLDIEKNYRHIRTVQNRALLGNTMQNEMFCKFTYDLEMQDKFAVHVTLEKEYIEHEIIEDAGDYCGIHFTSINDIDLCADNKYTYYGNKIALIKPLCDEVYYEYMDGVFEGRKVYVEKVMYMDKVETWEYLSQRFTSIKEKKSVLCQYLIGLAEWIPEDDYSSCITFLENL